MTHMCSTLWTLPAARITQAPPRFRQPNCPPKGRAASGLPPKHHVEARGWAESCQNGARAQVA
eukprot:5465595-Pyramimonas_sp.AAC.1